MTDEGSDGGRTGTSLRRFFCHVPYFYHRVVLLVCAAAISVPVIYKSRPDGVHSIGTTFSVLSSSHGYFRIIGDVKHSGVYPLDVNTMTVSAIKMAEPLSTVMDGLSKVAAAELLANGTVLHVTARPNGNTLLTKTQMTVSERLVMGIPLDISTMSETDFDRLPGLGPVTANRICKYRQKNGGLLRATDLLFVEGIGEKKYKSLLKYF